MYSEYVALRSLIKPLTTTESCTDLQLRVRTATSRSLFGAAYGLREGGMFIVLRLLRHGASGFPVSINGPPH